MGNTYTQIHLQLIFAVKFRAAMIHHSWKHELLKYITGIVQNNKHKLLIINGVEDHLHALVGFRPHQSISDLLKDIKANSSKWINENKFTKSKFHWQEGYGAFSYSRSDLTNVINYIKTQEDHHRKVTFIDEYRSYLKEFEIEFDERYLFKEPE